MLLWARVDGPWRNSSVTNEALPIRPSFAHNTIPKCDWDLAWQQMFRSCSGRRRDEFAGNQWKLNKAEISPAQEFTADRVNSEIFHGVRGPSLLSALTAFP